MSFQEIHTTYQLISEDKIELSDPDDVKIMYQYMTRGIGFEEDNNLDRSTFFHILQDSGSVHNLDKKESKEITNCFWFGGVGYISGWCTLDMFHHTIREFKIQAYEAHPEHYSSDYNPRDPDHVHRISTLYMCINSQSGEPERRWVDIKRKRTFRSERMMKFATGQVCICQDPDMRDDHHMYIALNVKRVVCNICVRDTLFRTGKLRSLQMIAPEVRCGLCKGVIEKRECKHRSHHNVIDLNKLQDRMYKHEYDSVTHELITKILAQ
jgi:hypothetical protein